MWDQSPSRHSNPFIIWPPFLVWPPLLLLPPLVLLLQPYRPPNAPSNISRLPPTTSQHLALVVYSDEDHLPKILLWYIFSLPEVFSVRTSLTIYVILQMTLPTLHLSTLNLLPSLFSLSYHSQISHIFYWFMLVMISFFQTLFWLVWIPSA